MSDKGVRLEVIILAAGQGTRMHSDLAKVLHTLGGQPMLAHVLNTASQLAASAVHVVYGHGGEQVRDIFDNTAVNWVEQAERLGTGHAVAQAIGQVSDDAIVLVLYGDVPLIRPQTLAPLVEGAEAGLALLTAILPEGGAYGRIVRDDAGAVARIVEKKDASEAELAIREINTGFLAAPAKKLRDWLTRLTNDNTQGEYYLTDIVALAVADGISVQTQNPATLDEIEGINSKAELARMERIMQNKTAQELIAEGVTLRDPARFDLRGTLKVGRDVIIDVNVILEGEVELGDGVRVGPNCVIQNTTLGAGTEIFPNCVMEDATVGKDCRIGPFARLRPGSKIADNARIGNFVEVKNSEVGIGSKVNHLTYIGDSTIGKGVNIGAGVITANYDGANKHRTVIGDNVSIGANNVLVAPVNVGEGATLGAGTVLRKDAPAGKLTLNVSRARTIDTWERPKKKPKKG